MMILPVSGLLMTPEVHYYFQKDYIERLTKEKAQQDEDVLFLIMKDDKKPEEMTAEDFYPVGLMGTVTEVESDGSISVQAKYRVDAEVLGYEGGKWDVSCSLRPDIADMDEQSREQAYKEVQGALLQFVDGFQWGIVARTMYCGGKTWRKCAWPSLTSWVSPMRKNTRFWRRTACLSGTV